MRIAKSMGGHTSYDDIPLSTRVNQYTSLPGQQPPLPEIPELPVMKPQMIPAVPSQEEYIVPGVYETSQAAPEKKFISPYTKRAVSYTRGPYKKHQPMIIQVQQ
jgi:hypothetical protein